MHCVLAVITHRGAQCHCASAALIRYQATSTVHTSVPSPSAYQGFRSTGFRENVRLRDGPTRGSSGSASERLLPCTGDPARCLLAACTCAAPSMAPYHSYVRLRRSREPLTSSVVVGSSPSQALVAFRPRGRLGNPRTRAPPPREAEPGRRGRRPAYGVRRHRRSIHTPGPGQAAAESGEDRGRQSPAMSCGFTAGRAQ